MALKISPNLVQIVGTHRLSEAEPRVPIGAEGIPASERRIDRRPHAPSISKKSRGGIHPRYRKIRWFALNPRVHEFGGGYFRIAVVCGGRMMRRLAVGIFLAPIGTRLRR